MPRVFIDICMVLMIKIGKERWYICCTSCIQCILPLQTFPSSKLYIRGFQMKCILLQCECLAQTLFIRHKVIVTCNWRAAPVCPSPHTAHDWSIYPALRELDWKKHHNKSAWQDEDLAAPRSGWIGKDGAVTWKDTAARDIVRKWQLLGWWEIMERFRETCCFTYPNPDTESAYGWAWSEPFLSLPCRTARPLLGPSRTTPGRRSAGRLLSWCRRSIGWRTKHLKEMQFTNS